MNLPADWHAHFRRIAKQEVRRMKALDFWIPECEEAIAYAIGDAWMALTQCARQIENVFGYVRVVMRYRLISMYSATARRIRPIDLTRQVYGNNGEILPRAEIGTDPWEAVEFAIASAQLVNKHRGEVARYSHTKPQEIRTRQAESNERARFAAWYQNSKRRRYD